MPLEMAEHFLQIAPELPAKCHVAGKLSGERSRFDLRADVHPGLLFTLRGKDPFESHLRKGAALKNPMDGIKLRLKPFERFFPPAEAEAVPVGRCGDRGSPLRKL